MNNNVPGKEDEISRILDDPEAVRMAIQYGINAALLRHKQSGNPVCVWRDNKVVWIAAENIKTG